MQRCVYCQAELPNGARACHACGREQPGSILDAPTIVSSGEPTRPCPNCGAALPLNARFCANCGRSFVADIGFAPLAPGIGAAGHLPGQPGAQGTPGWPHSGAPHVQGAPAGPQSGFGSVPSAPGGPQSAAPHLPGAPAGPQGGMPGGSMGMQGGLHSYGSPPSYGGAAGRVAGKAAGRSVGSKLMGTAAGKLIATVVAIVVVAAGGGAIAAATGHNPLTIFHPGTSGSGAPAATTTPPPPPEVAYVGSDGNVWEMTLPKGTPKQLTTDAKAGDPNTGTGGIIYGGLAWSPDGSMLAAMRTDLGSGYPGTSQLLLFTPTGTLAWKQPMPPMSFGPVIWSPGGKSLAYRQSTDQFDQNTGNFFGNILVVDAKTGATQKTVNYNAGPGGCGGGGFPSLQNLIMAAHHAFGGIDTFSWSPDGQTILVAYGCLNGEAAVVVLSSGTTTPGYPAGASFQPGGHLILGTNFLQGTLSLELTDLTGKQVRVLASSTAQQGNSPYAEDIGLGTWSSDGQTIYYEYQDGIWRVSVNGSGAKQIIAGTQISNGVATAELNPSLSPDGKWLLYLQASGDAVDYNNPASGQWYIAQADGSGAAALPQGAVQYNDDAIWRP